MSKANQRSPSFRSRGSRLRHSLRFDQALALMHAGEPLRLQYRQCRPFWWLGDGQDVAPDIAALLLNCTNVEPAGDALFPDALGQSRRIRQ